MRKIEKTRRGCRQYWNWIGLSKINIWQNENYSDSISTFYSIVYFSLIYFSKVYFSELYLSQVYFSKCIQILSLPFIPSTFEVTTFKFNSSLRLRRSFPSFTFDHPPKNWTPYFAFPVNVLWSWFSKQDLDKEELCQDSCVKMITPVKTNSLQSPQIVWSS